MSIFRSAIPVDMINWPGENGDPLDLVYSDASTIVYSDGIFTETFYGSFYNVTADDAYGRLDAVTFNYDGQLTFVMSQIDRNIHTANEIGRTAGSAGYYSYLLSGDDRIFVPGSDDNVRGFAGNDYISGGGGNDVLLGEKGLDRLYGGNGADALDGGTGGDLMVGGNGNDHYYTDNPNDRIVEAAGQGTDTIFATASRAVDANVENLTLLGTGVGWVVGNALGNLIRGNDAGCALSGGAGADWITGGAGNDRITGGSGTDHLAGGAGSDLMRFADATGRDVVHAFQHGLDRLDLRDIDADAAAAGNQAFSYLGRGGFAGTAGELRYDGLALSGDVNGDGLADFQIEIANRVAVTAGDLLL